MLSKNFRQDSAVICGNPQSAVRKICCIGAGYVGKLLSALLAENLN
jgi:hypothetical protein